MKKTVALAISGGIDSAVSAYLLKELGYEVLGIHYKFWTWANASSDLQDTKNKSIKNIKEKIGIQIKIQDYSYFFKKTVVDNFLSELSKGRTPNPCVICNPLVKFKLLKDFADKAKINHISTGHYARVENDIDGCSRLLKGIDNQKDQSYMLCYLNQEILSRTIFPLGNRYKREIYDLGKNLRLQAIELKESQDLCFINADNYKHFLGESIPHAVFPGGIVNTSGETIGQHKGLAYYTIGQRKGIKVPAEKPYYVLRKDIKRNQLVIGNRNELGTDTMMVINPNWIHHKPKTLTNCDVKIRYRSPSVSCTLEKMNKKTYQVKLTRKLPDITPGQYAVFYTGDEVLGGGKISHDLNVYE